MSAVEMTLSCLFLEAKKGNFLPCPSPTISYHVLGEAVQHALVEDFTWRLWYNLFPLWQETHSYTGHFPVAQRLCEVWHEKSTELGVLGSTLAVLMFHYMTLGKLLSLSGS